MSFDLTPSATGIEIYENGTQSFTVGNFIPATATYQGVIWNIVSGSDKVTIMTQSATGCTIKGISAGTATLQVASIDQNVNKTITVTVNPVTLRSFDLNIGTITLDVGGKTETIIAQNFIGTNDQSLNGVTINWSIEGTNTTGSTISPATGLSTTVTSGSTPGTFVVRATADGKTQDCTVTIDDCSCVTDAQDNSYTTAKFGAAGCWMTQNLRTTTGLTANANPGTTNTSVKYYWYPNNSQLTFTAHPEYGLLYTWAAATNRIGVTAGEENTPHANYQGICPSGWHVPSDYEWGQLEEIIAKSPADLYSTTGATDWLTTYTTTTGFHGKHGQKMKSMTDVNSNITNGTSNSHTDNGFDALLVGCVFNNSHTGFGTYTAIWSSSSASSNPAIFRVLVPTSDGMDRSDGRDKWCMFSVRCKKNDN
jgi:uncharacterized protein (TIGR02145 family)